MPVTVLNRRSFNGTTANAGAGVAVAAGTSGAPSITTPAFGFPVYTQTEIDAWSTSSSEYDRLANDTGGDNSRTITDHGTSITTTTARNKLRDDAVYAKCQAALWAADGSTTRRNKVLEVLDGCKDITTYSAEAGQDNLVAGWFGTNLVQAARITGYSDPAFDTFLTDVVVPKLWWNFGCNWWASQIDSGLAIAAYLEDQELFDEWTDIFHYAIARTIYHATHDGVNVKAIGGGTGWTAVMGGSDNLTRTENHWGNIFNPDASLLNGGSNGSYLAEYPLGTVFPNGMDGEGRRDYAHSVMGLGGWVRAARTILANGGTLQQHAIDRILANADYLGGRCLHWLQNGTHLAPAPVDGDGGGAMHSAWHGVKRLLGEDTPENVVGMIARSEVQNTDPTGANGYAAESFADNEAA